MIPKHGGGKIKGVARGGYIGLYKYSPRDGSMCNTVLTSTLDLVPCS